MMNDCYILEYFILPIDIPRSIVLIKYSNVEPVEPSSKNLAVLKDEVLN